MGASISDLNSGRKANQLAVVAAGAATAAAAYYLWQLRARASPRQLNLLPPGARNLLELNLSGQKLDALPDDFGACYPSLTLLNLGGNNLTSLPASFSQLRSLRILFFLGCQFSQFPTVLRDLPSLYMLSLKSNRLESIPEGALSPRLTWLILTDNRLRRLPDDIASLTGLRKLMLTGNLLSSLPDAITQCLNLELVRLSDNCLEALPAGMLQMPKLAWIALAGNPMAPISSSASETPGEGGGSNSFLPPGAPPRFVHLRYEDLELGEELGRGAGGVVTKAVWSPGRGAGGGQEAFASGGQGQQETVVVKAFNESGISDGRPENEQAAWASVPSPHPNTVACLCAFSRPKLGVVFEYLPGLVELGNPPNFDTCTRDTFKAGTSFSPDDVLLVAVGVAAAAAHLHAHGFAHGDMYVCPLSFIFILPLNEHLLLLSMFACLD